LKYLIYAPNLSVPKESKRRTGRKILEKDWKFCYWQTSREKKKKLQNIWAKNISCKRWT